MAGIYVSTHTGEQIDNAIALAGSISFTTTEPTVANEGTQLQIVFLTSEPSTKLPGWIYVIYNENTKQATKIIAKISQDNEIILKQ